MTGGCNVIITNNKKDFAEYSLLPRRSPDVLVYLQ